MFCRKKTYQIAELSAETLNIPFEQFKPTLDNYDRNAFVQFLFDLFPDCSEEINSVLKMYLVGTLQDYTCFPSIDRSNRICRAKADQIQPGDRETA
jgi:hypothetical protein